MLKLFNNHQYVILHIKQNEKADVFKLANYYNLSVDYPDMFKEEIGGITQICIDDDSLGGHLMSMICCYEIDILKNKHYRVFKNVKELKDYVRIANQRKEHYFVTEKCTKRYYSYVKTLSFDALKEEYFLVKNIVDYTDSYYLATKDFVEKTLSNSIKRSISKKEDTLEPVYKQLNKVVKLRNELDDVLNTNIYLINRNNYQKEPDTLSDANNANFSQMRMRSYLKRIHSYFHSSKSSSYFHLNIIYQNLDIIFNIFNYKLKAEEIISYEHCVFDNVRNLGYPKHLPNYLIGEKKGKEWDYVSVLKRLLYMLKFYDSYSINKEDFKSLIEATD